MGAFFVIGNGTIFVANCRFLKLLKVLYRLNSIRREAGFDTFVVILLLSIVVAAFWPSFGFEGGGESLGEIANWGVSLIFFFYGLKIERSTLLRDLSNWKLHFVVQLITFLLFPLIAIGAMLVLGGSTDSMMWLGVLFLAALPSTVSSSVVMVSIAGGNIPSAIFNASISGIIGIFVTPLWMKLFYDTAAGAIDVGDIIIKLSLQVLLPVVVGFIFNFKFGEWARKNSRRLKLFDQTVILLIVYSSFSDSFEKGLFEGHTTKELALLTLSMATLFLGIYGLTYLIERVLRFSREDGITALFCGSKKSLIHGTVISKALFPNAGMAGIVLLPLMIFHIVQLVAASIIAQKLSKSAPPIS